MQEEEQRFEASKQQQRLIAEIERLKQENEMLRKALFELAADYDTRSYNEHGTALNIKRLLQGQQEEQRGV